MKPKITLTTRYFYDQGVNKFSTSPQSRNRRIRFDGHHNSTVAWNLPDDPAGYGGTFYCFPVRNEADSITNCSSLAQSGQMENRLEFASSRLAGNLLRSSFSWRAGFHRLIPYRVV